MTSVTCKNCGRKIECNASNSLGLEFDLIACPACENGCMPTLVAVEYENKYATPNEFLISEKKNGILPITNEREKRTFEVLRYLAQSENPGFPSQSNKAVRILWKNGVAIGFYTDYLHGRPTLSHIFVRDLFRRQGNATEMVNNFMENRPGEEVTIRDPNDDMMKVLEKMGLVEKKDDCWIFINKMKWVPSI